MFADWPSILLLASTAFTATAGATSRQHEDLFSKRQSGHSAQAGQIAAKAQWKQLHQEYLASLKASLDPNGNCTWDNMVVRKEWGDMTHDAKQDYLRALWCMKELPSKTPQSFIPGVRSRWDDFTVAHLLNVGEVHRSPWLAVWHRHYVHELEKAMREECGMKGGHPYWHWSKYLDQDISTWPMFDNSPDSISGNGTQTGPQCACIESGPLANFTINLGPAAGDWGCQPNPQDDGLGYNPHCIERTFQLEMLNGTNRYSDVVYVIKNATTATDFASLVELRRPSVHNYPHLFMGGTQIDISFSSQDPWFFHHHAMLEFVFDVWQSRDWASRTTSLPDPDIFVDVRGRGWSQPPPNPNLDSTLFLAPVFQNITAREAMWPQKNGYCWRYE